MSSPFYLIIRGEFVIVGKEPDGDSVRFIADHSDFFQDLHRAHRIRLSSDGSVQLRFEGIDAPEVHYGTAAQPLGTDVRDQLLAIMGFRNVRFESQRPNRVEHAQPDHIMGAILTQAAEANGRPVSYLLLDAAARTIPEDEDWVRVDEALLRQTLNHQLLDRGLAYYTVYTSTPASHRAELRRAAAAARDARRGIWAQDATSDFQLQDQDSIGPGGQLILPKLFRRCTDYLKAVADGFRGNLGDWLVWVSESRTRNENDRVVIRDSMETHLSELLDQRNDRIAFQADVLDITFVEK